MNQTFQISGLTCTGCESKVKELLSKIPQVTGAKVDFKLGLAEIESKSKIGMIELKNALKDYPKYQIIENGLITDNISPKMESIIGKSWMETYKPILLIFGFILGLSLLSELKDGFQTMRWMNHFMAGFFLVFSFFKLLNLRGFASSYSMYDILAKRFWIWGFIYPFLELGLGIGYFLNLFPLGLNFFNLVLMSISMVGVVWAVFQKQEIQCACLGDVFNLPMSTVTIIEDGLMVLMSGWMLISLL